MAFFNRSRRGKGSRKQTESQGLPTPPSVRKGRGRRGGAIFPSLERVEDRTLLSRLFAAPENTNTITELNPVNGAELNSFAAPENHAGEINVGLAYDGTNLWYLVGGTGTETLYQLDPDTGDVRDADTIITADFLTGLGTQQTSFNGVLGTYVFINSQNDQRFIVFDPTTDTVVTTVATPVDIESALTGANSQGSLYTSETGGPDNIVDVNPQTGGPISPPFPSGGANLRGLAFINGELFAGQGSPAGPGIDVFTPGGGYLRTIDPGYDVSALGGDDPLVDLVPSLTGDQDFLNQDDTFLLRLDASGEFVEFFRNGARVAFFPVNSVDQINVFGLGGNDTLTVDSTNGLVALPLGIRYDGGTGFNTLTLDQTGGATHDFSGVQVGAQPGSGIAFITDLLASTQVVDFENLAPINFNAPAVEFQIAAIPGFASLLNADNAINYTGTPGGDGQITIDQYEPIRFRNKAVLILDAGAGSDTINLNNPATPVGLTGGITINGADPTGSDTLVVNGIAGSLDNLRLIPTGAGAGRVVNDSAAQPEVAFSGVEHLKLVVQQADDDDIRLDGTAGNDTFVFTPGANASTGTFTGQMDQNNATGSGPFALVETSYSGANSTTNDVDVNFFNPGGTDALVFNGTSGGDAIRVGVGEAGGAEFRNTVNGLSLARVEAFNVTTGFVQGLSGDDTFDISPTILTSLTLEGGEPSASDVLNLTGNGTAMTVAGLGGAAVTATGGGLGTVSISGIEHLNLENGAGTTAINGTGGNDAFVATPAGGANTALVVNGASPRVVFNDPGVTLGGAGGTNSLRVEGTVATDNLTINPTTIVVNAQTFGYTGFAAITLDALDAIDGIGATGAIPAALWLVGSGGSDVIDAQTATSAVTLEGGLGGDILRGGSASDYILGGDGVDIIFGGTGADSIYGGSGDDTIQGGPGLDRLYGEEDNDTFNWFDGDGSDNIEGGTGSADHLVFNGFAGAEDVVLSAAGTGIVLTRTAGGSIIQDTKSLEVINLILVDGKDSIVVNDLTQTTLATLAIELGAVNLGAGDAVTVHGRNVADNLQVTWATDTTTIQGLSYNVALSYVQGGPDNVDLTILGNDGDDKVSVAPVVLTSGPRMIVDGGAGNDWLAGGTTMLGGLGDDTLIAGVDSKLLDGGPGVNTYIGNGGSFALLGSGADILQFTGTPGSDDITVSRAGNDLKVEVNGVTTTFLGAAAVAGPLAELQIDALAGDDNITIDINNQNNIDAFAFVIDGGAGLNSLSITGDPVTLVSSISYTPGPITGSGQVDVFDGTPMGVGFANITLLDLDVVSELLVVLAGDADNAISYSGFFDIGIVSVDGLTPIAFANQTRLLINAGAGSDTISLNNPDTPAGLTNISVVGNDPTGSDTLVVNGTAPTLLVDLDTNTITGAGPVPIDISGIEHLTTVMGASTTLRVEGGQAFTRVSPGANPADGTIATSLIEISFKGLSTDRALELVSTAVGAVLIVEGSSLGESVDIDAGTGVIDILDRAPITALGFDFVDVNTLGGVDFVGLTGGAAPQFDFLRILTDGPNSGDQLTLAPTAAVTINGIGSVSPVINGGGFSLTEVVLGGIERVVAAVGLIPLTLAGGPGLDRFTITQLDPATGLLSANGTSPDVVFSGADILVDGIPIGADELVLEGVAANELLSITPTTITMTALVFDYAGFADITFKGNQGNDTIVATGAIPARLTLDGGIGDDILDAVLTTTSVQLLGGDGEDVLLGGDGDDRLEGGAGDDLLDGAAGFNRLFGGEDSDTMIVGAGTATVEGNGGTDTLILPLDAAVSDLVRLSTDNSGVPGTLLANVNGINHRVSTVEIISIPAEGLGALPDTYIVDDLESTDVREVVVNSEGAISNAADTLIVNGTARAENFAIDPIRNAGGVLLGDTVFTPWGQVTYLGTASNKAEGDTIILNAGEGDDSLSVGTGAEIPFFLSLRGDSGHDLLDASESAGGLGIPQSISLLGGTGNDTLIGTPGDDFLDGGPGNNVINGNGGTDTVLNIVGVDQLVIPGTENADLFIVRRVGNDLQVVVNGVTSTYVNGISSFSQVRIDGKGGDDRLIVDVNGTDLIHGPTLVFNGDLGADVLEVEGTPIFEVLSTTYVPGPQTGAGRLIYDDTALMTIEFTGLEPVIDSVPALQLIVVAGNADNAVSYTGTTIGLLSFGVVAVDNHETIAFRNKDQLVIDAGGGSDTISLNNTLPPPTELVSIIVVGSDPTASDSLVVNGTQATIGLNLALGNITGVAGAGVVVSYSGIEHLSVVAGLATTLSISDVGVPGEDVEYTYVPGATNDTGTIFSNGRTPVAFKGFGAASEINLVGDAAGLSGLIVEGTAQGDFIDVEDTTGTIRLNNRGRITTTDIAFLAIESLSGDDDILVTGPQPYFNLTIDAGDPSASDVVEITGDGVSAMFVDDLGASGTSVFGGGVAVTVFSAEQLFVDADGQDITVTLFVPNDSVSIRPVDIESSEIKAGVGGPTLFAFTTADLIVDLTAVQTATVGGTGGSDVVTIDHKAAAPSATTVTILGLQPVTVNGSALNRLTVDTGAGSDLITVNGTGGLPLSVLASAPSGGIPAETDSLTVNFVVGGAVTFSPGATPGTGLIDGPGGDNVDFAGVEFITLVGGGSGGNSLQVQGTNADDTFALGNSAGDNFARVNNAPVVEFSNFATVQLDGRFGNDTFNVAPVGLIGVTGITVNGGNPGSAGDTESLIVEGTAATQTVEYSPTSATAGSVDIVGASPIVFTNVEALRYDGNGGNDDVTVTTPTGTSTILTSGPANDAGAFVFNGPVGSLTPLTFKDLGAGGTLTLADAVTNANASLLYYGTPTSDEFNVTSAGTVQLNSFLPVSVAGFGSVTLDGLDGDDEFDVVPNPILSLSLLGGNPSASDIAFLTGDGSPINILFSAGGSIVLGGGLGVVDLDGIELLNLTSTGAGSNDVFFTTIDPAPLPVEVLPISASSAAIRVVGQIPEILVNITGVLTILDASADDTVTVYGSADPDIIGVVRGVADTKVTVNAFRPITIGSSVAALVVNGGLGGDTFNVSGASITALTIDGSDPTGFIAGLNDVLNYTPAGPGVVTVSPGIPPDSGLIDGPVANDSLAYYRIEAVNILPGPGPGNIIDFIGTNLDDCFAIEHVNGQDIVVVNENVFVLPNNVVGVNFYGLWGNDCFEIAPVGLTPTLTEINVYGGTVPPSPLTAGQNDRIIVEGSLGTDSTLYSPTSTEDGTAQVNSTALIRFFSIEHATYDGNGGGDTLNVSTPGGRDFVTLTPGANFDSGGAVFSSDLGSPPSLPPIDFKGLDVGGRVVFLDGDGGRTDVLHYLGTALDDKFSVDAALADTVLLNNQVAVGTSGILNLLLAGLDGDDVFNVFANSLGSLRLEGGNPSASDVANLVGDGTVIDIFELGSPAPFVVGGGLGVVDLTGVEVLNLDGKAGNITVSATTSPNAIDVTPTGTNTATIRVDGISPLVNTDNTGSLLIAEGFTGSDTATVHGTALGDAITVVRGLTTTVTVNALKAIALGAQVEALVVDGGLGADTFTLTGLGGSTLFVDGGEPSNTGATQADRIVYGTPASPYGGTTTLSPGQTPDSGLIDNIALGAAVNYGRVEFLTVQGAGGAGDTLVAQGTHDNDTFALQNLGGNNLIWINDRPVITFAGHSVVTLQGRFGDDTFSVHPVGLVGVTTINVQGGDPVASDHLLVSGTTADEAIGYLPIGPDAGSVTITGAPTVVFTTTESVTIDGQGGGDDLVVTTPGGLDTITLTPGPNFDSGHLDFSSAFATRSLTPLTFEGIDGTGGGVRGTLSLANAGGVTRQDTLIYRGTASDDKFSINAAGEIALNSQTLVLTPGVIDAVLEGLGGGDKFTTGLVPFASLTLSGGGTAGAFSDVAVITTSVAIENLTLALHDHKLSVLGGPSYLLPGIQDLTVNTGGGADILEVTQLGETTGFEIVRLQAAVASGSQIIATGGVGEDRIAVFPISAGVGRIQATAANAGPAIDYVNFNGGLTVNGGGTGSALDTLALYGSEAADTVTSTASTITVRGEQVTIGSNIDRLEVFTLGGNDTVTLSLNVAGLSKFVDAGAGSDTVDMSGTIDATILGGDGNDSLIGSPAADEIQGGLGNDTILGLGGVDSLYGGDGDDSLIGGTGNDEMLGGADNDIFVWNPGDGSDLVEGGTGTSNRMVFNGAVGAEVFALFNAATRLILTRDIGGIVMDTADLQQVEINAIGGLDQLTVNDLYETSVVSVVLNLGDNLGGADLVTVQGRTVADNLVATAAVFGTARVEGLEYNVVINQTDPLVDRLTILGNDGDDVIKAAANFEVNGMQVILVGDAGDDYLSADATLIGGSGDDTLVGGPGADSLDGGTGNDSLSGFAGNDTLLGGEGDDTLDGGTGTNTVDGGNGVDVIPVVGTIVNDLISVVGPDNALVISVNGVSGTNSVLNVERLLIDALAGNDTVTLNTNTAGISALVDLGPGNDSITATGTTAPASISGGDGDDTIVGTNAADFLSGGSGDDSIVGGIGNDQMYGDADNDIFVWNPGDGSDLVEGGTGTSNQLIFNGSAGSEVFTLSEAGTRLILTRSIGAITMDNADIQRVVINALAGNDDFRVNDLYATSVLSVEINMDFDPLAFADVVAVQGRTVADNLVATADVLGTARVEGLEYNVLITGTDPLIDRLTIEGNDGDDVIKAAANFEVNGMQVILVGDAGDDYLSADATLIGGSGDDTLVGGPGADSLDGGTGNDSLSGFAGNDTLLGGEGDDTLDGGTGTNTVNGGDGFDIIPIVGTDGEDVISAIGPNAALVITVNAAIGTNNVTNVERLMVDGKGGDDVITLQTAIRSRVAAGEGNDTVTATGSTASITILGGDGEDILFGGTVADRIEGGDGNDSITGGLGNDSLFGDAGSDVFSSTFLDGDDTLEGGEGDDIAVFAGNPAVANEFLLRNSGTRFVASVATGLSIASISAADVEQANIVAGTGADEINILDLWLTDVVLVNVNTSGTNAPDAADDCICVNGRNVADDIGVVLVNGVVQVEGLKAQVNISNSTNNATAVDDLTIYANAGDDKVAIVPPVTTAIDVFVFGGFGNDSITGGSQVEGGDGDDTLIGTNGPDTLIGGPGNDLIRGLGANDLLIGDGGIIPPPAGDCCGPFTPVTIPGGFGDDTIYGGTGDDSIAGDGGNDLLFGEDGNDLIGTITVGLFTFVDSGDDTVYGGRGNDTVNIDSGNDLVFGDDGEDLINGGADNDTLNGNNGNDTINGNTGDDLINGGNGNDSLFGNEGNDTINGDAGADQAFGDSGDDVINGGTENDTLFGGTDDDTISGNEGSDTILGESGNDSLLGNDGSDAIDAGVGNDFVSGGTGDDSLLGRDGFDTMFGDAGRDSMFGGSGDDVMLGGDDGDTLCGEAGNDSLAGEAGPDLLLGGEGDDSISGGDSPDTIFGGSGADFIEAGAGDDFAMGGVGNDTIYGNDGNDWIFGNEDNDLIIGGFGDDTLIGNTGDDQIHGGDGNFRPLHQPFPGNLPSDGNDWLLGNENFDRLDAGNGNNFLDAGDDGIRETIVAGNGNDNGFLHNGSGIGSDIPALDGGQNIEHTGGYIQGPASPVEPPCNSDSLNVFTISTVPGIDAASLVSGLTPPFFVRAHTAVPPVTGGTGTTVKKPTSKTVKKPAKVAKKPAKVAKKPVVKVVTKKPTPKVVAKPTPKVVAKPVNQTKTIQPAVKVTKPATAKKITVTVGAKTPKAPTTSATDNSWAASQYRRFLNSSI